MHEGRDSKQWIRCIRWSPNGKVLAVGSADHDVYLYSGDQYNYPPVGKCRGHNFGVMAVDFSDDSAWLRSSCGGKGSDEAPLYGPGSGSQPGAVIAHDAVEAVVRGWVTMPSEVVLDAQRSSVCVEPGAGIRNSRCIGN